MSVVSAIGSVPDERVYPRDHPFVSKNTRKNLTDRSPAEELWLWRRRQLSPSGRTRSRIGSGMSQAEAAERLGISSQRYHDAEAGRLPGRDVRVLLMSACQGDNIDPKPGELCALARRRAGWTLELARQAIGRSRVTFLELERIGSGDVINLWVREGYTFS